MKATTLLSLLLIVPGFVCAQKTGTTFRNIKDSTANYYITVEPVGTPKGLLVLLPGFGELPESAYVETELPKEATQRGLVTAIITLQQGWQSFYIDEASQQTIGEVIREIQDRYKLAGKKLYLGGFSLGGSGAVRYAERASAHAALPKPNAVFAGDPPLDFVRFYEAALHQRKYGKVAVAVNEASFLIDRMDKEFGGPPTQKFSQYVALAPYCRADTMNSNADLLKNMPIRLISEPDLVWQLTERNRDLYDLNTIDCVGLINYLRTTGNMNAVFVPTTGKGYRKQQKNRNPHSWSIIDPKETLDWLLHF